MIDELCPEARSARAKRVAAPAILIKYDTDSHGRSVLTLTYDPFQKVIRVEKTGRTACTLSSPIIEDGTREYKNSVQ